MRMTDTNQPAKLPQVNITVRAKSETPTRLKVQSGKFKMIIDEPEAMGGTNLGPSPIQVLLMSLAGCLGVTGHAIARQKGLKLNDLKIEIKGNMNPCNFMGCSFEERAGFQNINVVVNPKFEAATPEQIEDWLQETEKRCPVTDNIKTGTHINVTVKQPR